MKVCLATAASLAALLLLAACQQRAPELDAKAPASAWTSDDPDVVARYDAGHVTAAEIDRAVLEMSAAERPLPGVDLDGWYRDLVRRMVVDRVLRAEVEASDLSAREQFRLTRIGVDRQLSVQSCFAARGGLAPVSEDELAAAYEARQERFRAPERRSAYQIFRRVASTRDRAAAVAELEALRDRVLQGERFQLLASRHSDSESRHRQGSLGWVVRGQLAPAIDQLVFELEEGVPSRPLVTEDGVHLFQVDDVLPERRATLEEVRRSLRQQLAAERAAAALDELAAMNARPQVRIVGREEFEALVDSSAEQDIVLQSPDYTLSLAAFRVRLGRAFGQTSGGGSRPERISNDAAWDALDRMRRHEAVYEYCSDQDLIDTGAVERQLARWQAEALLGQWRQQRLQDRVLADRPRLERFYRSNAEQFTRPVEWRLARLQLPFDDVAEARRRMALLEQAAEDERDLEQLQRELGGDLETLEWQSQTELQRLYPLLPARIAPLGTGDLAPPLRIGPVLEIYQVLGRRTFEPPPLEEIEAAVAAAYLRQYASDVYAELEADLLESVQFEIDEQRLTTLRRAGVPEPEITVEQLEALFEGQ